VRRTQPRPNQIIGYDFSHRYSALKIVLIGYQVKAIDTQVSLLIVIMMSDADLIGDNKGPPPKRARPETPLVETPNTDSGGFRYDIIEELPDEVLMTNDGNDGVMANGNVQDLMTGLDSGSIFDGSISSPNDNLLQNGPLPVQGTLNKGSPAVTGGSQMSATKSMGITSPGPDLNTFPPNRPPQVPVSTTAMATPPTPLLNPGSMRSTQAAPLNNMSNNTPSSSVAT
jgi:hypothetical protein